jgi:homoserine O-succinyltransferase/O-acetyltransferase
MTITSFSRGAVFTAQTLPPRRPRLKIGLLNNMPDAAMAATEHQFSSLLQVATEGTPVTIKLFALSGVPRGEAAQVRMRGRYQPAELLRDAELDGLIVTGAEPRAPELDREPYWPALSRVIDWTESTGMPTIWSCLAAHAAVQRLSRIRRKPLPAKLSGVFKSLPARDDALLDGVSAPLLTPHSRQNGLVEEDLVEKGYRVLTRSGVAGVDAFVRRGVGLSLFFQGHPEYDADTLMREYIRDVSRFLDGRRPHHPETPSSYFEPDVEAALAELSAYARRRPNPKLAPYYGAVLAKAEPTRAWRGSAVQIYRNWLRHIAEAKRPKLSTLRATHSFA